MTPSPYVLWIDTEASQALLLERAKAWSIPLDRIRLPSSEPLSDVQLDDEATWQIIEEMIDEEPPLLIVIDSLRGAHGGDENDSKIVALLKQFAALARRANCPVLVTHHLRKSKETESKATPVNIDRVRGSTAIVAMARIVLAIDAPDPLKPGVQKLTAVKSNLGPLAQPLGFEVKGDGVAWQEPPAALIKLSKRHGANKLLLELLADGPVPYQGIERAAKEANISMATMEHAKADLGITSEKDGHAGWSWQLPRG